MGMAGDQDAVFLLGILVQAAFCLLLPGIIFRRAGGVQNTEMFQGFPEIPYKKTGDPPENRITDICLMSVGQIQISGIGNCIFQNNAGVNFQAWEQRAFLQMGIIPTDTGIMTVILLEKMAVPLDHVVVSMEHIKAALTVKMREQAENITVYGYNLGHIFIFPQFITVPQFNISISQPVVILQGGKI